MQRSDAVAIFIIVLLGVIATFSGVIATALIGLIAAGLGLAILTSSVTHGFLKETLAQLWLDLAVFLPWLPRRDKGPEPEWERRIGRWHQQLDAYLKLKDPTFLRIQRFLLISERRSWMPAMQGTLP
jgi:hypothetical protein